MIPAKLKSGDGVRIITPARSLAMPWLNEELQKIAIKRLEELGLKVSFSEHVNEIDEFNSSTIKKRVDDLHEAFKDKSIKLIITVIGGFNSNQLLRYLDYDLIKNNPKILCGYSDITALANAIYAKTGLVTYSGLHFFSFGEKRGFDYSLDYFKKCLFSDESFEVLPSKEWSDDLWANDQENREFMKNDGFWIINEGEASGKIIGGNLCTLQLLHGTEYIPNIKGSILFLEDDYEAHVATIDRDIQSIIHQPEFKKVQGIVIGRFQKATKMTKELLTKIIKTKKELNHLPVIANVDFGHTNPMITFPIGGTAKLLAKNKKAKLEIVKH
ncbi:LD-carboxypeptidase [Candidatus Woesearchaeota archaeon CG10_big_fil_rev_8_21_14_0_10_45_16]|nr:MAG: LD-carboxypeptidase [Candidatus Woesearchaeota archaeon CG10_big_fil_rev_8_21_14_0_10_45_16]